MRTGERDLHSGLFGGAALNAMHALMEVLQSVLAGPDGRLPETLRTGTASPTAAELESWQTLTPGAEEIASQGARPMDAGAEADFYPRTWASPAVDVHGLHGGSPLLQKTVLPVEAEANISIRLAPGQDPDVVLPEFERLLREAAPKGAEVEIERWASSPAGLVSPDSAAVQLALDAFEEATGTRPLLVRSGGSIPIVPALAGRGIPVVVSGFSLPDSNIHSPNERLLADYLPLGVAAARAIFTRLGQLG